MWVHFFPVSNHISLAAMEFILFGLMLTVYDWITYTVHTVHSDLHVNISLKCIQITKTKYRNTEKHAECVSFYFCWPQIRRCVLYNVLWVRWSIRSVMKVMTKTSKQIIHGITHSRAAACSVFSVHIISKYLTVIFIGSFVVKFHFFLVFCFIHSFIQWINDIFVFGYLRYLDVKHDTTLYDV